MFIFNHDKDTYWVDAKIINRYRTEWTDRLPV